MRRNFYIPPLDLFLCACTYTLSLSSGLSALVVLWKKSALLLVEAFINLAKASRLLDSRLFPTWFTPSSPPFQKVVGSRSLSGCLAAKHPFSTANQTFTAREKARSRCSWPGDRHTSSLKAKGLKDELARWWLLREVAAENNDLGVLEEQIK